MSHLQTRRAAKPRPITPLLIAAAVALGACDFPKDPGGASERIEAGVLKVGVAVNPPWVEAAGPEPSGIEPDLVRRFAAEQKAKVQWVSPGEGPALDALEKRRLDIVIAGLDSRNPWAAKVGATRPYAEAGGKKHIWAAAPGENQLLLRLDRFLAAHRKEVKAHPGVRSPS